MAAPSTHEIRSFYRTALAGLYWAEARKPTGRRFGSDADARWAGFRGDLTTADRLDLLLRDADAEWPGAFGARSTFAQKAVAEDDAFGAKWPGLLPVDAEELWQTSVESTATAGISALFQAWSAAWDVKLTPVAMGPLSSIDRWVVAGPSAVASLVEAFASHGGLSWAEQVTVIATPPSHRQLAYLSALALNLTKSPDVRTAVEGQTPIGRALVSDDAAPEDARIARGGTT
ncbi:MAG: hypothetical protein IPK82_21115 [Polyangiaceae bacterium]|nr:hypothetical protein [Polyangiaceae bacterium]